MLAINIMSFSKPALNIKERNIVKLRQELVFDKYVHTFIPEVNAQTIGISKSFLTNTFYPLFHNFFNRLGFTIILGTNRSKPESKNKMQLSVIRLNWHMDFFQGSYRQTTPLYFSSTHNRNLC